MAKKVVLNCEKCGSRNYTFQAKEGSTIRLELKKFCTHCNKHTVHKQTL